MKDTSKLKAFLEIIAEFFGELIVRFISKSPSFFRVFQIIGLVLAVVYGLPEYLASKGVQLPTEWTSISDQVVAIAGLILAFMAKLPVAKDSSRNGQLPLTDKAK